MIVTDASVMANALTDDGTAGECARQELARDVHWAGPDHLTVEVFSAVRGRWLGRQISAQRALDALAALGEAAIDLMPTMPLLRRMWELRDNVSGYDAAYVALAEALECTLVTADARLARAQGLRCEVTVALPSD